jgi:hypothetical protein
MNYLGPQRRYLGMALALATGIGASVTALGQPPAPRPKAPHAGKAVAERTAQRPPCQQGDKEGEKQGARRRPPAFEELDLDGDGYLSGDEAAEVPLVRMDGFDAIDADGDGLLSKAELPPPPGHPQRDGARGDETGARGPDEDHGPSKGRRPPHFDEADVDGDGVLSPEEAGEIPPVQREGFEALDEDGDGYLTREEVPPPPLRREHGTQAQSCWRGRGRPAAHAWPGSQAGRRPSWRRNTMKARC